MMTDKEVLVVDTADGSLSFVMEELSELGFRVIWVSTLDAALDLVRARSQVSLIILSAVATAGVGLDFVPRVRELAPDARIIWGVRGDTPPSSPPRADLEPDRVLREPFRADELRTAISELLTEHFYPPAIADAVKGAALEVLGTLGGFHVESGSFLAAKQTALSDLSAVIPFSGGISGHLMAGLTSDDARALYEAYLPGVRPVRIDCMEDLVGELCNQILGRINAFFVERSVSIQHGTPIFIRASGSPPRYPGRQPSFAVTLARGALRLSLEYYLADFDRRKLHAPVTNKVLGLGEIRYL